MTGQIFELIERKPYFNENNTKIHSAMFRYLTLIIFYSLKTLKI